MAIGEAWAEEAGSNGNDQSDDPPAAARRFRDEVAALLGRIRSSSAASARSPDIGAELDLLRRRGVLRAVLPSAMGGCALGRAPGTARPLCDMLRLFGRADLSLARLFEGHVNAALLVETHGDRSVLEAMRHAVDEGALLGVWGADGPRPAECRDRADGSVELRGTKRYASGLGHVRFAVITAKAGPKASLRMFLVPADDPARHDHGDWTASAMRATRSGAFDLGGMVLEPEESIGGPGDMMVEPWFEGGVWRYCAAHVGGAEGLIDRWAEHLSRLHRRDDPLQRARLGRAMAAAVAARASVESMADAVEAVEGGEAKEIERVVSRGLLVREAVEMLCTEILSLCERALGMAAHDERLPIDAMRRDLSLFLRQAGPDAKLDRALGVAFDGGVGSL